MRVKDYMKGISHEPLIVQSHEKTEKIAEFFLEDPKTRTLFVVNEKGVYLGYITIHALLNCLLIDLAGGEFYASSALHGYELLRNTDTAADIMEANPAGVQEDSPMTEALVLMKNLGIGELPVLDRKGKIIEELHVLEVLEFWKTQKNRQENPHA